ncbi:hypothetical protein P4O66_012338 [Electrophorus voltai]|uniref:Chemokine interleukin-8-like domain-containing protein n=2 Tax=Electrophorus TaxID=8004 RepID=A0AAD9DTP3_9TELE|nr:hypothetical protein P4O66_012338 [Electrophorus voltai]
MSRSTLVLLLLFALTCAELSAALRLHSKQRCLCRSFNKAHLKNIQNWKVFHPSAFCDAFEIVGMLKNNRKQFCLDPSSRAWKTIMYAYRVSV